MPETTLKATLEIESDTRKAQAQIDKFIKESEKKGHNLAEALFSFGGDTRRSSLSRRIAKHYSDLIHSSVNEIKRMARDAGKKIDNQKALRLAYASVGKTIQSDLLSGRVALTPTKEEKSVLKSREKFAENLIKSASKQKAKEQRDLDKFNTWQISEDSKEDYVNLKRLNKIKSIKQKTWQGIFLETIKNQTKRNPVFDDMAKFYRKQNKENSSAGILQKGSSVVSLLAFANLMNKGFKIAKDGTITNVSIGRALSLGITLFKKYSSTEGIKKRANVIYRLFRMRGVLPKMSLADIAIGAGSAVVLGKLIAGASKYIFRNAEESVPYGRAISGGGMTGLGAGMYAYQRAGFSKKEALEFRTNLQNMIGQLKLGRGNAAAFMSLGINALDSEKNIQKQLIERMRAYSPEMAVALGGQLGLSAQQVYAMREGYLDIPEKGYSDELMNRYKELQMFRYKLGSWFDMFQYNTLGTGIFSLFDSLKAILGGGAFYGSNKMVAKFSNLIVNVDKDGKASIANEIESNEIDWGTTAQQMGDNNGLI